MGAARQGRLLVGRFEAVKAVVQSGGGPVHGLFEVTVVVDHAGREVTRRASYFAAGHDGEPSRFKKELDALAPAPGEWVAVKVVGNVKATRIWALRDAA